MAISSLETHWVVQELDFLNGAVLEKVHQIDKELFKFVFKQYRKKHDVLVEPGVRINLTAFKLTVPVKPSNFAMLLRKYLAGKKLISIKQHKFDRIVEFDFNDSKLIVELFAKGNLILTDADYNILFPFKSEAWKDREIRKGQKYKYPQSDFNALEISENEFQKVFDKHDVVRSIAINLGFGGELAEHICNSAGVQKQVENPDKEQISKLYNAMINLVSSKPDNTNTIIDDLFLKKSEEKPDDKLGFLQRRLDSQQDALIKFKKDSFDSKQKGDLIYSNFDLVKIIIDAFNNKDLQLLKERGVIIKGKKLFVDLN